MKLHYSKPGTISSSTKIDQDYLRRVVTRLAFPRVIGTPQNKEAQQIVKDEFQALSLQYEVVGELENIVVGNPKTAKILIGAHYDSVPGSPGADDNASAVAVMLAAAGLIKNPDVMFVAFNSEEYGLAGSDEFVKGLGKHNIKEAHILEMVGFRSREPYSQQNPLLMLECPDTGDFLGIVSNSQPLVDRAIQCAGVIDVPVLGFAIPSEINLDMVEQYSPHLLRSDHAPFWENGISAAMWTDTAEFRNKNYHKASDLPETLDYEFMGEVAKLLVQLAK